MIIAIENPRQPEVEALLRGGEAHAESLYPAEENFILPLEALEKPGVTVFVARLGGVAMGMAALVATDEGAELKRLFVSETARGRGVSHALLDALEEHARTSGVGVVRLETGDRSVAALGLYESRGYRRIPLFGEYVGSASSVCMEKVL